MVLLSSVHVYFDYIIFTFRVKDNSVLTVTNDDTTVAINFVPLKYHSVNVVIDLQVQLAFKKYSINGLCLQMYPVSPQHFRVISLKKEC